MALRRRCFALLPFMTGFLRCCWFYVSTDSVYFSRFVISHALRYRFLVICCCHAAGGARPPAVRTTAQPYTAGRPTPPRLHKDRLHVTPGLREESPPRSSPAARVRRQLFMTEEDGVRLRSSLFWENGPVGICKTIFAEPIAPKSTKLQGRVGFAFL